MLDGTFDAIEVASKTQIKGSILGQKLVEKVALMQANNPDAYFYPIIWLFG